MDYTKMIENAKIAYANLKDRHSDIAKEFRIFIQFKNGSVYQYRLNTDGLAKLKKIDFSEVILIQLAGGVVSQQGRFSPTLFKMLFFQDTYIVPQKKVAANENPEFNW